MFDLGITVLVVDDMMTMRKIVMKSCKDIGFTQFVEAADGIIAWNALEENKDTIGLVISDWNMPNCTGLEFLKKVRADERFKDLPFVLLTAESEAEQVKEAIVAGVDNYVVKPFTPAGLKEKLEQTHKKKMAA